MRLLSRRWLLFCAALAVIALGCKEAPKSETKAKTQEANAPKDQESDTPPTVLKAPPTEADATPTEKPVDTTPTEQKDVTPSSTTYDKLDRASFNQLAVRLNAPVFWKGGGKSSTEIAPEDLVTLLFYPSERAQVWVANNTFTPAFDALYQSMLASKEKPIPEGLEAAEAERLEWVIKELDSGKPTLVFNDLSGLSAEEKNFVRLMLEAGALIDELYATQSGIVAVRSQLDEKDLASQSLFRRNWGPTCKAPGTESEANCNALASKAKPPVDIYPAALQEQAEFCKTLEQAPNAKELLDPFTVVRSEGEQLIAVPYTKEYATLMQGVAEKLTAAVEVLGQSEPELRRYLSAAAESFGSNDWTGADEAWAAMNARNSKWYVRVGPDETYWEPCSQKAGFHLTFALINPDSLSWEEKLLPHQQAMEDELAALIGEPYAARTVTFHLPDFIDIVGNHGDDRDPFGATIGQSLPNWGAVANEGRGRTVVMSNLYTDADSLEMRVAQAQSLFHSDAMKYFEGKGKPNLLSTILHEATHNFGPSHEYKVDGKVDDEIFGGPLATVMEELKAQTGTLYYIQLLVDKGVLSVEEANETYADCFLWAMGHISRGMYTADKQPRPYSQLAAIQLGYFMEKGAIEFDAEATAPNGSDKGVFVLHLDKFAEASKQLMTEVGKIKGAGDKAAAEALIAKYVDAASFPAATISERMLRYPKASMVY
ncbi:MAG: hypothetical protein RBU37_20015, partial [Myxococcota bacterium]|nr:hypothetical protein [Myxococcota bacterium]